MCSSHGKTISPALCIPQLPLALLRDDCRKMGEEGCRSQRSREFVVSLCFQELSDNAAKTPFAKVACVDLPFPFLKRRHCFSSVAHPLIHLYANLSP